MTTTALLPVLLHLVAIAIGAMALVALPYVIALINRRTKPGVVRDTLELVATLIGIGVRDAAADVASLKSPTEPGTWNAAAAAAIKARVIADVRAAEPAAVATLARAAADPSQADALLARLVESELAKFRATEASATVLASIRPPAPYARVVTPGERETPTDPTKPYLPKPPALPGDLKESR